MAAARRYESLDTLRGVAALAVVLFHIRLIRLEPGLMPHGYLAVDFFFILSGFVIAHAYQSPLMAGMRVSQFLARRLVRLYPLALAGAVVGVAAFYVKWRLSPATVDTLPQILLAGALNTLMLPDFFGGAHSYRLLFPVNAPMWSLFFELAVNVAWALLAVRLSLRWLVGVIVVGAIGLIAGDISFGSGNQGVDVPTFWYGVARVIFGFTLGVVIYRMRDRLTVPLGRWGVVILGGLLIAVMMAPIMNVDWDLAGTLVVLPLIVWIGAAQEGLGGISKWAGDMSYPIYALHFPLLILASGLHRSLLRHLNVHLLSLATLVIVIAMSWIGLKLYDEPVRRALSRPRAISGRTGEATA